MSSRLQSWAILGGIYAQILFVVSWLIFGYIQGPHYSWLAHSISDMYAVGAPLGLVLVVIFTICGALTMLLLALGVWPVASRLGFAAKVAMIFLLLSIYGLGDLLSPFERLGCRLADAGCTVEKQLTTMGGKTDQLLSSFGILLFIIGIIMIAHSVHKWKSTGWISQFLLFGAYSLIPIIILMGVAPGDWGGAFERLIALLGALLLMALGRMTLEQL